jgi:hypothetical protein
MKTETVDATVITSLSLDRELVRDLTSEEMNGANGGAAAPHPDTNPSVVVSVASEGSPVSVVLTIIGSIVYSVVKTKQ